MNLELMSLSYFYQSQMPNVTMNLFSGLGCQCKVSKGAESLLFDFFQLWLGCLKDLAKIWNKIECEIHILEKTPFLT